MHFLQRESWPAYGRDFSTTKRCTIECISASPDPALSRDSGGRISIITSRTTGSVLASHHQSGTMYSVRSNLPGRSEALLLWSKHRPDAVVSFGRLVIEPGDIPGRSLFEIA